MKSVSFLVANRDSSLRFKQSNRHSLTRASYQFSLMKLRRPIPAVFKSLILL